MRTGNSLLLRQAGRFLAIGAAGTTAYLVVYLLLRESLPAQPANVAARVAVAVPTTWANGRLTFDVAVRRSRLLIGAVGVLAAGIAVSAGVLGLEQVLVGSSSRRAEVAVLVLANALATVVRFALLRHWVFGRSRSARTPQPMTA